MTHIEQAIREAIAKGYKNEWQEWWEFREHHNRKELVLQHNADWDDFWAIKEILLDPLFWQALGKARGWDTPDFDRQYKGRTWGYLYKAEPQVVLLMDWQNAMHDFIDHLAEGKDADSFFATL